MVVADDLTGAADASGPFARRGRRTRLCPGGVGLRSGAADSEVYAVNIACRHATPSVARSSVVEVLGARPSPPVGAAEGIDGTLLVKIDSCLRGNPGAMALGVLDVYPEVMLVAAPAVPDLARTTVDGVQFLGGTPVRDSEIWAAEPSEGPADVVEALAPVTPVRVPLAAVRTGGLARHLRLLGDGDARAVVCDAETRADLSAIVEAGRKLNRPVAWIGAAGLAEALAKAVTGWRRRSGTRPIGRLLRGAIPILIVVGSRSEVAHQQVRAVEALGCCHLKFAPDDIPARTITLSTHLNEPTAATVVSARRSPMGYPSQEHIAEDLASLLAPALDLCRSVVLTGGDTAQAVLHAAGITSLQVLGEFAPGVVVSDAGPGRPLVITKAGSFGIATTLADIVKAARGDEHMRERGSW